MAFLHDKFFAGLPKRVQDMRAAIDALATPGPGAGAREETLARLFHSLAGIGGTYGYHEITFLAKAGEDACFVDQRRDASARVALLHAIVDAIATAAGDTAAIPTSDREVRTPATPAQLQPR